MLPPLPVPESCGRLRFAWSPPTEAKPITSPSPYLLARPWRANPRLRTFPILWVRSVTTLPSSANDHRPIVMMPPPVDRTTGLCHRQPATAAVAVAGVKPTCQPRHDEAALQPPRPTRQHSFSGAASLVVPSPRLSKQISGETPAASAQWVRHVPRPAMAGVISQGSRRLPIWHAAVLERPPGSTQQHRVPPTSSRSRAWARAPAR